MTIWAVSLLRSELSPGFLTAAVRVSGIRSLVENPTVAREFSSSSSTSRPYFRDASPQAISERTSYRRTRLEFLLYTQVIPECCTARGFGPPRSFTFASPCSYVARPASGLVHAIIHPPATLTRSNAGRRPYQARFHYASPSLSVSSFLASFIEGKCRCICFFLFYLFHFFVEMERRTGLEPATPLP